MSTQSFTKRRIPLGLFGLTVCAFGLLLWARLILVTGHPRVATADPAAVSVAVKAAGDSPAPAGTSVPVPQGSHPR